MGQPVSGSFKFKETTVDYNFQIMGPQKNECFFRMKFNRVPLDAEIVFAAGLHLMHYLANDFGFRLDITAHQPQLPTVEETVEAVEKNRFNDEKH